MHFAATAALDPEPVVDCGVINHVNSRNSP